MMQSTTAIGDCQICLKTLSECDLNYPLICPTACGFNMCKQCVTHLVSTSIGMGEESPGLVSSSSASSVSSTSSSSSPTCVTTPTGTSPKPVKKTRKGRLRLQCPNCRGNIALTIKDTLLLRSAHEIAELRGISDSELNGAELRQKHAISAEEIQEAQLRIDQYVAGNVPKKGGTGPTAASSSESTIDTSLLFGLQEAMTDAEKEYVTELMTSGQANKLAQAAQILSEMERAVRKGQITANLPMSPAKKRFGIGKNDEEKEKRALAMMLTKEEQEEKERKERHDRMYPLPDRMPRCVIMKADFDIFAKHNKIIKFVDDGWDGTVADAYSRVHLTEAEQNTSRTGGASLGGTESDIDSLYSTSHSNSVCGSDLFDSDDEDDNDSDSDDFVNSNVKKYKNRVLVKKARRYAAKQGVQKGDVISHLNGDEFKGTAADLREAINQFYMSGNKEYTFSLTLNAEQSTAAALKLRAMVDGLMHDAAAFV